MINVIIVEDENIVRIALSTMITWEEYGYKLCGMFKNGKDALEYLLKFPVDIVLTDIKMPVMSGDILVEKIQELKLNTNIIVLSNYDDFALVKKCFKFGIRDYLLKQDIDSDSLLAALQSISVSSSNAEIMQKPQKMMEDMLKELAENDFQNDPAPIFEQYTGLLNEIKEHRFFIGKALFYNIDNDRKYSGVSPPFSVMRELIREVLDKYFRNFVIMLPDHTLCFLFLLPDTFEEDEEDSVKKAVMELEGRVKSFFNMSLQIGFSSLFYEIYDFNVRYVEACCSYEKAFFTDNMIEREPYFSLIQQSVLASSDYRQMHQSIGLGDVSEAALQCSSFLAAQMSVPTYTREAILEFARYIMMDMNHFFTQDYQRDIREISQCMEFNENYHLTLPRIACIMSRIFADALAFMHDQYNENEMIQIVKTYIAENYQDPELSLQSVAETFHINASYLSSLFKASTGVVFTQYVTETRVHHAVLLAKTTKKTGHEIAELTGYGNPNYFVKVFKKVTGFTVSEIRTEQFTDRRK